MGRKKKIKILPAIKVTGTADRGKCVGRHEEQVVFVDKAVPGDVVDVFVFKKRKTSTKPSKINRSWMKLGPVKIKNKSSIS